MCPVHAHCRQKHGYNQHISGTLAVGGLCTEQAVSHVLHSNKLYKDYVFLVLSTAVSHHCQEVLFRPGGQLGEWLRP